MSIFRSTPARIAVAILLGFALCQSSLPALALSREEAERTARSFLGAFLEGDEEAARYAAGDLQEWRAVLNGHLPGPGDFTGYEILTVKGSSKARKAAARIARGELADIFYLDFDSKGRVSGFYTMVEALGPMVEELRQVTRQISELELRADSYSDFEALMLEQQRVASRIKNLLWRHRQMVGTD